MNILTALNETMKTTEEVDLETKAIIGLFSETNLGPEDIKPKKKGKDILLSFLKRRDRKILAY